MSVEVFIELAEKPCPDNRICVDFKYDPDAVWKVKAIPGRTFVKSPRRHWHVPKTMETCRALREAFGKSLHIGPNLHSWATEAARQERQLGSTALATTATLTRLPQALPTLYRAIHVGPVGLTFTDEAQWERALREEASFQAADVRFLADAPAPLNANEQGLGKTPEWIAAVWEAGLERGDHLVICNAKAVDGTWEPELEKWQQDAPCDVAIYAATGSKANRQRTIEAFFADPAPVRWLVVNMEMVRWRKQKDGPVRILVTGKDARGACRCAADRQQRPHVHYSAPYPELHNHTWDTLCIDECHKGSIRNHRSLSSKAAGKLKVRHKRCAMSGTPAKKRGADIWGVLNWLRPDHFSNYWQFAGAFFKLENNGFGTKVLDLLPEREEAFYRTLTPYVVRRLKTEVLPWLPPKHHVEVLCTMGDKQEAQYRAMEAEGVVRIGDADVTTTSVLAEFTRLSQFANAYCEMRGGEVWPTAESCKVDAMLEKMEEADVFDDPAKKQIVFSQSRRMVEVVADVLRSKGLKVDVISGGTHKGQGALRQAMDRFNNGDTQIMCIVTQAGGVSLTLTAADTAHMLDDSWAPDETAQAEDRLHRVTTGTKQVTIYHYRSRDTIDLYRRDTAEGKAEQQQRILDARRKLMEKYLNVKGRS